MHVCWMGICHVIFVHVGFCEPFIKTVWAFCVPCVPSIILGCGLGDDKNIVCFRPYMRTRCIFPNVSRVGSDIGFSNEFSSHFTSFIVHLVLSCSSGVTEINIESQWLKYSSTRAIHVILIYVSTRYRKKCASLHCLSPTCLEINTKNQPWIWRTFKNYLTPFHWGWLVTS